MAYPKWRYHREKDPVLVMHAGDDPGTEWADSPLEFGIITAPAAGQDEYDPSLDRMIEHESEPEAKRRGRPKKEV